MVACSPDLDLFTCGGMLRHESGSFEPSPISSRTIRPAAGHRLARAILTAPEAVEFLPWLKAALPVESVVNLEAQIQPIVEGSWGEGDWNLGTSRFIADAFVNEVRGMRLRVRGETPFERMSGAVDRVLLGLQEEERLRAAMVALLSGVVVSCECPAYPNRWRKRLRRSGQKSLHPSLFEADSMGGGEGPLLGMSGSEDDPLVSPKALLGGVDFGDGGDHGGLGHSGDRWGLFNGPACVWVWPPIDVVGTGNRAGVGGHSGSKENSPGGVDPGGLEHDGRKVGGLGNERSGIIGGVGSREPAPEETARARSLGGKLLGWGLGSRLGSTPADEVEPLLGSEGRSEGDSGGSFGMVSGGARGIDSAFMGDLGGSTSSDCRRWVILPQGLSVVANGIHDRNERGGIEGCSNIAQGDSRGIRWISAFGWRAGFSGTAAMLRNRLIYAFADETIVFSCRLGVGGTWGGAVAALREGRVVRVAVPPDFSARSVSLSGPEGCLETKAERSDSAFRALMRLGAVPLRFEQDFSTAGSSIGGSSIAGRGACTPSSHPAHPAHHVQTAHRAAGSEKIVKTGRLNESVPIRQVS